MAGEIVHHDHIAGPQLRQQYLLDVGLEGKAVDRSVDDEGRGEPAYRQRPDEGCGFSVAAMRDADLQAFAFEASVVAARHVGGSPGLVDKDETFRIKIKLAVEPFLPKSHDVGAVLLRGMRTLFCA